MIAQEILRRFPHTTTNIQIPHLEIVLESVEKTQKIDGAVVELGCNAGLTSVYIRRLLDRLNSDKEFHVYDSFQGLPPKDKEDFDSDYFKPGAFSLNGTSPLLKTFADAQLKLPKIHEGWFKDQDYPDKISFVFLDGDFYSSTLDGLNATWDKLQVGGIICIHDYGWEKLPGVEKAVRDFFGGTDLVKVSLSGLGVIKK